MEDKRKLTAIIMGAISAYIQMEQKPPQLVPKVEPGKKSKRRKIMPTRKK